MIKFLSKNILLLVALLFTVDAASQKNTFGTLADPIYPSIPVNPASPVFNANDVTYLNVDTAVAVGNGGMVWRSVDGGMNWSVISTFTATANNNSVIMKNHYICIAGDNATVTFSNNRGVSWANSAQAQAGINYHGVHFADTTFGAAVGDNGDAVIYHWIGTLGWAHIPTTLTQKLNAVASYKTSTSQFVDGFAFAVGDNGKMSTYSFGSWTNLTTSPTSLNLNGVYLFSDNVTLLVVGDSGLIMRSGDYGNSWSILNSGKNEAVRDISEGFMPNQFLAVGDSGVIYESTDNGFTFNRFTVGFNNSNLKGVSAKSPRGAFGGTGNVLRIFVQDSTKITGVSDSLLCKGDNFKAYFDMYGTFGANNVATLELSDATGSFLIPTVIGTKNNPQATDSITGTIPTNATPSGSYKIRLATSEPSILSPVYLSSFTVQASPAAQSVTVFNGTDLYVNFQSGCTYQWFFNSVAMSGETDTIVTTVGNGNYYVVITGSNGCTTNSSVFNYNATSINNTAVANFSVSPNPAVNMLKVTVPDKMAGKTLCIYNMLGKRVVAEKMKAGISTIDVSGLETGMYFLSLGGKTLKIIIEK